MKNYRIIIRGFVAAILLAVSFPTTHIEAGSKGKRFAENISSASAPVAGTYRLDAGKSRFMVKVFVGGLLSSFGHDHNIAIRDFSGTAQLTPGTLQPASLQLTIKADSLSVTDKVSASDKQEIEKTMREKVLETGKYPTIVFKSTRVDMEKTGEGKYRAKIFGDLTLHGVTHSGLINASMSQEGTTLRARGEFPLKQSDYNIERVSVAGGTIKVKDELKFTFDIVAQGE